MSRDIKTECFDDESESNNNYMEVIINEDEDNPCDNDSDCSVVIITKPTKVYIVNDASSDEDFNDSENEITVESCPNCENLDKLLDQILNDLSSARSELSSCALETISIGNELKRFHNNGVLTSIPDHITTELNEIVRNAMVTSDTIETTAIMLNPLKITSEQSKKKPTKKLSNVKKVQKAALDSNKLPKFPIDDPKILIELENKCQLDSQLSQQLKNKFKKCKLNDSFYDEYGQLVFRRLITDECIKSFSWTGQHSTIAVRDYSIILLFRESIHELYPNATDDKITDFVRNYIANAKGRQRRKMKNKNNIILN